MKHVCHYISIASLLFPPQMQTSRSATWVQLTRCCCFAQIPSDSVLPAACMLKSLLQWLGTALLEAAPEAMLCLLAAHATTYLQAEWIRDMGRFYMVT